METRCLYVNHRYGYKAEYIVVPEGMTELEVITGGNGLGEEENELIGISENPECLTKAEHDSLSFGQKGYFQPYVTGTEQGYTIREAYDD